MTLYMVLIENPMLACITVVITSLICAVRT